MQFVRSRPHCRATWVPTLITLVSLSGCCLGAPSNAVTVTPEWKFVLAPVIVTVIRAPTVAAILLGLTPVIRGAVGPRIVVSLNKPRMMNEAICPRVTAWIDNITMTFADAE